MSDLERAVETVVGPCLGVAPGEEVVIVADPTTERIAAALRAAAARLGAEPLLCLMEPRSVDGEEPPAAVAAALAAASVFIAPTARSLSHTRARKAATERGARGATLPGVTEDMLARLMACDFELMAARSAAVAELLTAASEAHVTCPRGTDLHLDLTGRTGIADDGRMTEPGAFGNLPCGEGFIAPLGGEGVAYVVSLATLGKPDAPLRLEIAGGRLASPAGEWGALLDAAGTAGRNLAELGVGTNERATLTGNILEDEKILGTVHIAFGASAGIGGTVAVPVHLDALIEAPTLDVGGARVLEDGRFVLAA
jgi:leucyl aminopeptidase (aminopeptidase T)